MVLPSTRPNKTVPRFSPEPSRRVTGFYFHVSLAQSGVPFVTCTSGEAMPASGSSCAGSVLMLGDGAARPCGQGKPGSRGSPAGPLLALGSGSHQWKPDQSTLGLATPAEAWAYFKSSSPSGF